MTDHSGSLHPLPDQSRGGVGPRTGGLSLASITDGFRCRADCTTCRGTGHVCEQHPTRPWGPLYTDGCNCGGAGMPCPASPFTTVYPDA